MRNLLLLCVVAATLGLGSSAAHAISATLSFALGDRPDAGLAAEVDAAELAQTLLMADEPLVANFVELYFLAGADTLISNADGTLEGRPAFRIHGPGDSRPFVFRGPHGNASFERRGIIQELAYATLGGEAISALLVTGAPSDRGGRTVTVPVPEPTTAGMLLLGLLGLPALARRPV